MSEINWKREIRELPARLESVDSPRTELENVQTWLQDKAKKYGLNLLLAHADDGVIWGRVLTDGELKTSDQAANGNAQAEAVCPELRLTTLQQARLFGNDAELLLWRDGDNIFHARLIRNVDDGSEPQWKDAFDEPYLLWGTRGVTLGHGFTLLEDGAQGLRHAIPIEIGSDDLPIRLRVRHYLAQEDFARVVVSRLVGLETKEK